MRKSTAQDLSRALTEFQDRASTLAALLEDLSPHERPRAARGWLTGLLATVLAVLAVGLLAYFGAISGLAPRVEARSQPTKPASLANARLFALYPDGRVEWTDPWSGRRLFQWDGHQWRTVDATTPVPAAPGPMPIAAHPVPPPAD